jgi:hypothetical protein
VTSPDGSVSVVNTGGPNVQIEIPAGPRPVWAKFSGAVLGSTVPTHVYLSDDLSLAQGTTVDDVATNPLLYPTSARTFSRLRVTNLISGLSVAIVLTLYKNGAPTAQTVTIPAASAVGFEVTDSAHPIAFADGDQFDIRVDFPIDNEALWQGSVVLEGPATGGGGSGGGSVDQVTSNAGSQTITNPTGPVVNVDVALTPNLKIMAAPIGGTSDDGPAIQIALNAIQAAGGGILQLRGGTPYRLKSAIALLNAVGITIEGLGRQATSILIDDSGGAVGDAIQFNKTYDCGIRNLTLDAPTKRIAGNAILVAGGGAVSTLGGALNAAFFHCDDVDMNFQFQGLKVQDFGGTVPVFGTYVRRGWWHDFNAGGVGYIVNTILGASNFASDLFIGTSNPTPVAYSGIQIISTGDFTLDNIETWGSASGLTIFPSTGQVVQSGNIKGCFFDNASGNCVTMGTGGTGTITKLLFDNCWFATAQIGANAVNINSGGGANHIIGINFVGCRGYAAAVNYLLQSCTDVSIVGCQSDASTLAGIRLSPGCTTALISGNRCTASAAPGILVDLGATGYLITSNNTQGTSGITDNGGAVTKLVANNL